MKIIVALILAITLTGCTQKEIDSENSNIDLLYESESVYYITYSNIKYISNGNNSYVEIRDERGNIFKDHGSITHNARFQYDNFYKYALNQSGVITVLNENEINEACYNCTSLVKK